VLLAPGALSRRRDHWSWSPWARLASVAAGTDIDRSSPRCIRSGPAGG